MTAPDAELAEAIRHIRERALRQVMAMCNRLKPLKDDFNAAYLLGHRTARMQLYDEIERMIASEAPPPTVSAGYFTSAGLEDG